jgi:hypothetical protein
LTRAVTNAPILNHFDVVQLIILQTDGNGCAIAGILDQYDGLWIPRLVNFHLRKCTCAEQNYDMYDQELLAIPEAMKQWRHYLEGANHKVLIHSDENTLGYFQTSKVLSWQRCR